MALIEQTMQRHRNFVPGQKHGFHYDDISDSFRSYLQTFNNTGENSELNFYAYLTSNVCTEEDRLKLIGEKVNGMFYQVLGLERYTAIYDYYYNTDDATRLRIDSFYFNVHGLNYKILLKFLNRRFQSWSRRNRPAPQNFSTVVPRYEREPEILVHLPYMPDFEGLQLAADGIGVLTATGIQYSAKPTEDQDDCPPPSNVFYDLDGRVGEYASNVSEVASNGSSNSDSQSFEIIEDDVEMEAPSEDVILESIEIDQNILNRPNENDLLVDLQQGAHLSKRSMENELLHRSLQLRNRNIIIAVSPNDVKISTYSDDLGPSASSVPIEKTHNGGSVKRLRTENSSWKIRKKDRPPDFVTESDSE